MGRFRPVLRAHGLTEQKWRLLRAMSEAQRKLRPIELSQLTCISMPSLSRLLKSMQNLQLIKDSPHAHDQRSTEFSLTPAGHALLRKVAPHSEEIYKQIERLVGASEVAQLYALCDRVTDLLGTFDSDIDSD